MTNISELKNKTNQLRAMKDGLNKQLETLKLQKQSLSTKIEMNNEKIDTLTEKLYNALKSIGYNIEKKDIIDSLENILKDINDRIDESINTLNNFESELKLVVG